MKAILSILFVFTLGFSAFADGKEDADNTPKPVTITVSGSVKDAVTGESLVGVKVEIEGTLKEVYTDFDGNFLFEEVVSGEYNISASYISYEKGKIEKQEIDIFTNELKVALKPAN